MFIYDFFRSPQNSLNVLKFLEGIIFIIYFKLGHPFHSHIENGPGLYLNPICEL